MSSKHTPAPWEVSHAGHGGPSGFVLDEYFVLNRAVADDVAIAAEIIDPATQMPSEANARLIAAAPELLEASRMLIYSIDGGSITPEEAITAARAAIAKATGEGA